MSTLADTLGDIGAEMMNQRDFWFLEYRKLELALTKIKASDDPEEMRALAVAALDSRGTLDE